MARHLWFTMAAVCVLAFATATTADEEDPQPFAYDDELSCLAFSPDGAKLAAGCPRGEPHVLVLDARTGERQARFETVHHTFACGVTTDGKGVFATSLGGMDRAEIWELETRRQTASFAIPYEGQFYACRTAIAPDGSRLATAGLADGIIRLWDVGTGKTQRELKGHVGEAWSLRFSRDGRQFVSGGQDGTARVWNLADGKQALRIELDAEPVVDVAFHANGKHLVVAGAHGTVLVSQLSDGRRVRTLKVQGLPRSNTFDMFEPLPMALSADGSVVVGVTPEGFVRTTTDGQSEPLAIATDRPFPFAVSADGRRLAAPLPGAERAEKRLRIWDLRTGRPWVEPTGESVTIIHVEISYETISRRTGEDDAEEDGSEDDGEDRIKVR